jgi:hypothetical protein
MMYGYQLHRPEPSHSTLITGFSLVSGQAANNRQAGSVEPDYELALRNFPQADLNEATRRRTLRVR